MTCHTRIDAAAVTRHQLICKTDGSRWNLLIDHGTRQPTLLPVESATGAPDRGHQPGTVPATVVPAAA